jgi:Domain of unknown function (DUF4279)
MKALPFATIRFFSENLSPEIISNIIHMKPDAAASKGAVLVEKIGRSPVIARTGTWFLSTKGKSKEKSPQLHLQWIIDHILNSISEIKSAVPEVQVDLSLLVHDKDFKPTHLSIDLLSKVIPQGDLEIEVPEANKDWLITFPPAGSPFLYQIRDLTHDNDGPSFNPDM